MMLGYKANFSVVVFVCVNEGFLFHMCIIHPKRLVQVWPMQDLMGDNYLISSYH